MNLDLTEKEALGVLANRWCREHRTRGAAFMLLPIVVVVGAAVLLNWLVDNNWVRSLALLAAMLVSVLPYLGWLRESGKWARRMVEDDPDAAGHTGTASVGKGDPGQTL